MYLNRIILHIDMDAFFPAVEERENPQFQGMPIIVGADPKRGKGRGVVSSASYLARKFGIKSGMPISEAYKLCPNAIFSPVNMELYQRVSEKIMEIVKKYSKRWEIVSLDEAYLDLSSYLIMANKVDKKGGWERVEKIAEKLKKEIIAQERLTSTVGIGPNKLIAKMATEKAKPNGLLLIKPAQVKKFLEPLDIEDLPGIGPKTDMRIAQSLSLRSRRYANAPIRIKDLKTFTREELIELLGKVGETIYERVKGIDEEPVTSEEIIKSIGKEHTFEKDTRDPGIIFETFDKILKEISGDPLSANISFRTITVICRFSGFETHTKSKTLNPVRGSKDKERKQNKQTSNGVKESTNNFEILKSEAKKLLLKFIVENPKPIRLIGLRVKTFRT